MRGAAQRLRETVGGRYLKFPEESLRLAALRDEEVMRWAAAAIEPGAEHVYELLTALEESPQPIRWDLVEKIVGLPPRFRGCLRHETRNFLERLARDGDNHAKRLLEVMAAQRSE